VKIIFGVRHILVNVAGQENLAGVIRHTHLGISR
jgi:hypothetical protein